MPVPIWFAPWKPGPAECVAPGDDVGGAAVVSVTGFAPYRPWTAIGVNATGAALRRDWGDVEGAVGLWLWTVPGLLHPRCGSVSVWRDEEGLRRFVGRHDHVRIMRAYRHRGGLRSTTWRTDRFDGAATRRAARSVIAGWCGEAAF
ncbi:hypothetical protein [Streptomyces griseus]|uniref:hypothetical protein n=1 Tax=Streptomyces griseus TaxID=1911 RepID=UPI00068C0083|nr:hypothetical protein [Streptomyces griseus]